MASPPAMRDIYVDANGLRHHLTARGNPGSPIVVMIHGLTQQAHVFDPVAARLALKFHVYCIDVRGRGETEWGPPDGYHTDNYVADLDAVREALGLDKVAIVGTSMGGIIGMQYAARHPEHVTRLVVNDIGTQIDPAGLQRIMAMLTSAPKAFQDMKAVVKYYRESNPQMVGGRDEEDVHEYARWHVFKNDVSVYTWKMDPAVRSAPPPPAPALSQAEAWAKITCPVLLVRGSVSDVLSPDTVSAMLEARPGTECVEAPGAGHAPTLVEPAVYQKLEAFLGG